MDPFTASQEHSRDYWMDEHEQLLAEARRLAQQFQSKKPPREEALHTYQSPSSTRARAAVYRVNEQQSKQVKKSMKHAKPADILDLIDNLEAHHRN
jgi:hypothetical protein